MNRFYYGNALQCRTEWVLGGCSTQARSFGGPAPSLVEDWSEIFWCAGYNRQL